MDLTEIKRPKPLASESVLQTRLALHLITNKILIRSQLVFSSIAARFCYAKLLCVSFECNQGELKHRIAF